jgi:hypothetical protein
LWAITKILPLSGETLYGKTVSQFGRVTMQPLTIQQLYEQYGQLRQQLERRQISHAHFINLVQQLRAQDPAGNWWTIDPNSGQYLTYTAGGWTPATPPPAQARPSPAVQRQPARESALPAAKKQSGCQGCLTSPITVGLLSFGSAALWLVYTTIRSSTEGLDLITPLLIGGVPFLLRLLQNQIDRALAPIYKILQAFPRPLLAGAALALPLVMGGVFTRSYGSGFGALRTATIVSVIGGYILTRRTEVAR